MGRNQSTKKLLDNRGAHWSDGTDCSVVEHFGDPQREYQAVVDDGLGIIERGERQTLVIHGPDAIPWFQGLVTNDLHALVEEGNGQRNALVNKNGRFIADPRVLHIPEMLVLDLEPGTLQKGLWSHLRGQIILEEVELEDRSEATGRVGLYGERAAELLESLGDWAHPIGGRPPFCGTWTSWKGHDLIVQRMAWSELPGYEIFCSVDTVDILLEELQQQAGDSARFGNRAFETMRVEAGMPRFGVELDDKVIPLEAGFDDAVAYDKGCYLGQEIIARLDTRGTPSKKLRRVILDGDDVPAPESKVLSDDEDQRSVGDVRSAIYSPRFDAPVALAYIKRKYNDVGNSVLIDGARGTLKPLFGVDTLD